MTTQGPANVVEAESATPVVQHDCRGEDPSAGKAHAQTQCSLPSAPVVDLDQLLSSLDAIQEPGVWVYAELPEGKPMPRNVVFSVREREGQTVVLTEREAREAGLVPLFKAAWITLRVHSALEAVGLVARVSVDLAAAKIPCNIVAGARHDHLLVPYEMASQALGVLRRLQSVQTSKRVAEVTIGR
ncbi:MAG: ACT domain-containing protein [Pseudomonadota bacterium]